MIQIIGFLICAALAVKLFEMAANPALQQDNGNPKPSTGAALIGGWVSVVGFTLWLLAQGDAIGQSQYNAQTAADCVNAARTVEAMQDCYN